MFDDFVLEIQCDEYYLEEEEYEYQQRNGTWMDRLCFKQ